MAVRPNVAWVTRDEPESGPLCSALRDQGCEPHLDPLVRCEPLSDGRACLETMREGDWLVLTSPRAVALIDAGAVQPGVRIAVVSEASARAARARGLDVGLVSPTPSAAGLWRAIATQRGAGDVVFAKSVQAPSPPASVGPVVCHDLYTTLPRTPDPSSAGRSGCVTFTSPTAVRSFDAQLPGCNLPRVCLGETTARSARERAQGRVVVAREPSFRALAEAVREALRRTDRER
ncbi:MAG: uroporphyrinogen-III synthase [Planctomycetota bacterium]